MMLFGESVIVFMLVDLFVVFSWEDYVWIKQVY